jgi:signal peptidase I
MKRLIITLLLLLPALSYGEALKVYTVTGDSMSPALVSGDKVAVSTEIDPPIKRGELIAIKFKSRSVPIIKRVFAISGDKVEIKNSGIYINGDKVRDIQQSKWKSTASQLRHYGWTIPPNNFFILGDNPENSLDSRRLGIISNDQIQGRVIEIIKKSHYSK